MPDNQACFGFRLVIKISVSFFFGNINRQTCGRFLDKRIFWGWEEVNVRNILFQYTFIAILSYKAVVTFAVVGVIFGFNLALAMLGAMILSAGILQKYNISGRKSCH